MDPRAGRRVRPGQGQLPGKLTDELLAYARQEFKLQVDGVGGASVAAHAEQAAKTLARFGIAVTRVDETPLVEFPENAAHVWAAFAKLSATRGNGGFGPAAITFHDIRAWCELAGIELNPWEVECICKLDRVFLEVFTPKPENKPRSQNRAR